MSVTNPYALDGTIAIDFTQVDTVATQEPGTIVPTDVGDYMYVQANGAVAQYALVKIDDSFQAAEGTSTNLPSTEPASVGVVHLAALADNEYGWAFVGNGEGQTILVNATCAADVKLYTTATAGKVDDASGGGQLINGLKLTAATAASGSSTIKAVTRLTVAAA